MQLLAVLHHIIYPEEQLADLPARVSRSSEALQARAQAWLNGAETPQMVRPAAGYVECVGRHKGERENASPRDDRGGCCVRQSHNQQENFIG